MAAAAAITGAFAAPAIAGEYHVYSCKTPDGRPAPTDGWSVTAPFGYTNVANACPADGLTIGLGRGARSANVHVKLGLQLPEGIALAAVDLQRRVWIQPGEADLSATPAYWLTRDDFGQSGPSVLEHCALSNGCSAFGDVGAFSPYGRVLPLTFAAPTRFLGVAVACGGMSGGHCGAPTGANDRAEFSLMAADLTVTDNEAPTVSNLAGSLREPGVKHGIETLSFQASDRGAGVYQVVISAEGKEISRQVVDHNGGRCADAGARADDLEFMHLEPCLKVAGVRLQIDTTKLPEGRRLVSVDVRDAAGNLTSAFDQRIEVDNVPPPSAVARPTVNGEGLATGLRPGDRLNVVDGAWSGVGLSIARQWQRGGADGWADIPNATGAIYAVAAEDVGRQLRVVVRASNAEGTAEQLTDATPVVQSGATVQTQSVKPAAPVPGPDSGCASCNGEGGNALTGQLVVDREQRSVQVRHGAKVVITGRLVDAEGRPLADASVDVFERLELTAAPYRKVATIKTDSQGGYSYRPKTTASRTLRFAFSAKRGETDYRATRDVAVSVRAKMAARAARRVVRRGGLIKLVGRVSVEALPKAGTWVEVQVLDAGVWRTVATRKTSRTGLWKFNHRLKRSSGLTFKFRARLRVSGDLASAESMSSPVKVRVR